MALKNYDHKKVEQKWAESWYKDNLYRADDFSEKPKKYLLAEFPYPSGFALHAGHMMRYTVPDVYARYMRMNGYNVMFPMGWDAFGLPAETHAIKTGIHPAIRTKEIIENFKESFKKMGYGVDWEREINTTDPNYYKWTQWIFLQFYRAGLAEYQEMPVWWCQELGVLADEEVLTDKQGNKISERGSFPVERKMKRQWVLKIPQYADKLLEGLNEVDWPEHIKDAQRNWIGRKEGINITYPIAGTDFSVVTFTTRPDTNFGATFIAISPEHHLVNEILSGKIEIDNETVSEIREYVNQAKAKSELERISEGREKTGVFTGLYAVNRLNDYKMPIWVADFVLSQFGTGAVVGVPGHDQRDFEFVRKYNIPVKLAVNPALSANKSYLMGGESIKNNELSKIDVSISEITNDGDRKLEIKDKDLEKYKQLIRQKLLPGFWNEVLTNNGVWFFFKLKNGKTKEFEINYYKPNEQLVKQFAKLACELTGEALAKTSNIWLFIGSNNWYTPSLVQEEDGKLINSDFLDGLNTHAAKLMVMDYLEDKGWGERVVHYNIRDWVFSRQRYWGEPIPLIHREDGKIEAVPEDQLPVTLPEVEDFNPLPDGTSPIAKNEEWLHTTAQDGTPATRETDTMPNWAGSSWYFLRYVDPHNDQEFANMEKLNYWLPVDHYFGGSEHTTLHLLYSRFWNQFLFDKGLVPVKEPYLKRTNGGLLLGPDGRKMSKSLGNIIDPMAIVEKYGADALRMYIAFLGPYTDTYPWNDDGVKATYKLLQNLYGYKNIVSDKPANENLNRAFHRFLSKISEMYDNLKMNTAVSEIMKFTNMLKNEQEIPRNIWNGLLQTIAPLSPFVTEELWMETHNSSIHLSQWPLYDEALAAETVINLPVQINGKLRSIIAISPKAPESDAVEKAKAESRISDILNEKEIKQVIYIPGKIINFLL